MIRKFYDAAVAEPVAEPPVNVSVDIAAIMAKQGQKSDPGANVVATPINIQPEKKEEPVSEPAKVEPTGVTPTEPAKPETPAQPTEPAKPTAPIEPVQQKVPTLQEVLKNHQPDAVLKQLGYDDSTVAFINGIKGLDPKMIGFLNYWQANNGDVSPYMKALNTDYSKLSAEDVMRHQLREDYPRASDQQIEALFKREVVQAYSLNSEDEAEVADGRLLLEAKADRYRAELMSKQQNFLFPKPPEPKPNAPDPVQLQQEKDLELYQSSINDSPITKAMIANKKLSIGEGETAYNHPVEPKAIIDSMIDPDTFANSLFKKETKPDGSTGWVPDIEKQLFIYAAINDFEGLKKGWADHYISIGKSAATIPLENPSKTNNETSSPAEKAPTSAAEAMAIKGTYNSGGR